MVSVVAAVVLLCSLFLAMLGGLPWLAALGLAVLGIAGGIVGLITGIVARRWVAESAQIGGGMALIGIYVGAITVGIALLLVIATICYVLLIALGAYFYVYRHP
jgi:hypothetical protein